MRGPEKSILRAKLPALEVLRQCSELATTFGYMDGKGKSAPSFGLVGLFSEEEAISAKLVVAGVGGGVLAGRPFVEAAFEECGCEILWQECE